MTPQSELFCKRGRYEFWTVYQEDIDCFEVYLDPDGFTYLGVCDDLQQVREFIEYWLENKD